LILLIGRFEKATLIKKKLEDLEILLYTLKPPQTKASIYELCNDKYLKTPRQDFDVVYFFSLSPH